MKPFVETIAELLASGYTEVGRLHEDARLTRKRRTKGEK